MVNVKCYERNMDNLLRWYSTYCSPLFSFSVDIEKKRAPLTQITLFSS